MRSITKRMITPHKGGRTERTEVRITAETKKLLKQLKLSAADLLEEAIRAKAKERGMIQEGG